ncbi:hypothetical protein GUJ93_ZPchr0001g31638 [Zizania palustris]|uniref:WRKY domain-containing protein n=1 Tax=Zizania palustris TaxID=103762 RepID=A0A8J5SCP5_ZIZPA|nr:hypothetical protein GUJ93_ZPchr0001g31638 [Zizania palustris]
MALGSPAAVVQELMAMGQQSAAHLGELLRAVSPTALGEQHQELTAEILRCCGRVIAALSGGSTATGKKRKAVELGGAASSSLPATPSKRRGRGAEAAREIKSDTTEDGYIWRKYGQKDINGCKHRRLYYRCAFRDQGCGATRRVQLLSQEDMPAFAIAYYGDHTCRDGGAASQEQAMPPTVVDHGSSNAAPAAAWGGTGTDRNMGSATPALLAVGVGQRSFDGDAPSETSQGWSPAFSSEAELGMSELLDGFRDWEYVFNSV